MGEQLAPQTRMLVTAQIHQGRRTVLEYLLSLLSTVSQEAGRERWQPMRRDLAPPTVRLGSRGGLIVSIFAFRLSLPGRTCALTVPFTDATRSALG
jgi:hypothetical protein